MAFDSISLSSSSTSTSSLSLSLQKPVPRPRRRLRRPRRPRHRGHHPARDRGRGRFPWRRRRRGLARHQQPRGALCFRCCCERRQRKGDLFSFFLFFFFLARRTAPRAGLQAPRTSPEAPHTGGGDRQNHRLVLDDGQRNGLTMAHPGDDERQERALFVYSMSGHPRSLVPPLPGHAWSQGDLRREGDGARRADPEDERAGRRRRRGRTRRGCRRRGKKPKKEKKKVFLQAAGASVALPARPGGGGPLQARPEPALRRVGRAQRRGRGRGGVCRDRR